jgi:UDP-2,3-diacylglucosamine hydrolase
MSRKTYFASDFHLGVDALTTSLEREKKIVRWLDLISDDIEELYLVGDVFDHWFEYRQAVPKGFVRLLGKLAELRDAGVPIYFFIGNHDMWMFKYFEDELGIPTYRSPIEKTIGNSKFYIGHGDGLGPGDFGYKMIKKVFNNPICQTLFGAIHPNVGLSAMKYFSVKSRQYTGDEDPFTDPQKEWLALYAEQYIQQANIDYFVFGHRHLPIDYTLSNRSSRYINLGEWMYASSYAVFDGSDVQVEFFESNYNHIYGK